MDKVEKFLRRIDAKFSEHLRSVLRAIVKNRLEGLDIAPLHGRRGFWRCRVRTVRIIFVKASPSNIVLDMDFRANIYKRR